MSEQFDAYHRWLGIKPKDQPPHHYRLLGIDLFESDLAVIEHAADQRMAHVRTFAAGKHAEQSQEILNELAAAKVSLLNAEKRAAYDKTLKAKLKPPPQPAAKVAKPLADKPAFKTASAPAGLSPVVAADEIVIASDAGADRVALVTRKSKPAWRSTGAIIAAGAAALLLLIVVALLLWSGDRDRSVAESPAGVVPTTAVAPPPAAPSSPPPAGLVAAPPLDPPAAVDDPPPPPSEPNASGTESADPPAQTLPAPVAGSSDIDLLTLVDVSQDAVEGSWQLDSAELRVQSGRGTRLAFPIVANGSYMYAVRFTRRTGAETNIMFPIGAGATMLVLSDSGGRLLWNREAGDNQTQFQHTIANDQLHTAVMTVRPAGDRVSVNLKLNGEVLIDWSGAASNLVFAPFWSLPENCALGLGASQSDMVFHLARLRILEGEAQQLRAPPAGSASPSPSQVTRIEAATPTAPPPVANKPPVPGDEPRKAALAEIRELYGEEFTQAVTPEQKLALAKQLFDLAVKADEVAVVYTLLEQARDTAVEAVNGEYAMQVVEAIDERFDIAVWQARADVVSGLAIAAKTPPARGAVAKSAFQLADDAVQAGAYDSAIEMIEVARRLAQRAREFTFVREARARLGEVTAEKKQWEDAEAARQRLEQSPDDPDANGVYGRFLCFVRDDWQQGLPYLLQSGDAALKPVLPLESTPPQDVKGQVKLGDTWWELSTSAAGLDKTQFVARACHWYRQSVGALTGLEKTRIEKVLEKHDQLWSQVTLGLVGHWKLDEGQGGSTAIDATGRQNGKYAGQIRWADVGGRVIPYFNGTDTSIDFGSRDFGHAFTIALWVNPAPKSESVVLVANTWPRPDTTGFRLKMNTSADKRTVVFNSGNGKTKNATSPDSAFQFGQWVHIAVIVDRLSTQARLFLNGKDVTAESDILPNFMIKSDSWFIASARAHYTDSRFKGMLSDVRLYNRVLSPREIAALSRMGFAQP